MGVRCRPFGAGDRGCRPFPGAHAPGFMLAPLWGWAPQDRRHLDVQKLRSQQEGPVDEVIDLLAKRRPQKNLHGRGSVEHIAGQARSRPRCCRSCSSREAAETPRSVAGRCACRSCHSDRAMPGLGCAFRAHFGHRPRTGFPRLPRSPVPRGPSGSDSLRTLFVVAWTKGVGER